VRKLWHKFLCSISDCVLTFYHDVEIVEIYDECTRKLWCRWCGGYFAMSDRHRAILPWDADYERIVCDMYGLSRTKR
jgi:hypothetical protein